MRLAADVNPSALIAPPTDFAHHAALRYAQSIPTYSVTRALLSVSDCVSKRPLSRAPGRPSFMTFSLCAGTRRVAPKLGGVERAEAEAILDGDRETAVGLLLRLDELAGANQRLVEANGRLEARVAELERRLNRSSRNSSLPPSQDPPSAPPRPRRPGSGRERGGQPGHEGKSRPLLPLERVDAVVEHWPERCQVCAYRFGEGERLDAAPVHCHQVSELPPIAVAVTEHRLHRL